jgi:hypothetical protein
MYLSLIPQFVDLRAQWSGSPSPGRRPPSAAKFFGRLVDTDCETLVVIDFIDHAITLKRPF